MQRMIKINPVNSLAFLSSEQGWEPPLLTREALLQGQQVFATSSCLAVTCYPEQDGPTEVVIDDGAIDNPVGQLAFDGFLDVPDRILVLSTAENEVLLSFPLQTPRVRVRIWTSHPRWPEKLTIGLG